jgi:hypothetical protein
MGLGCHPANLPTVTAISHADALAAIKKAEKPAEQGDNIFLLARNGSASVLEANCGGYKLHEKTRLPPGGRCGHRRGTTHFGSFMTPVRGNNTSRSKG